MFTHPRLFSLLSVHIPTDETCFCSSGDNLIRPQKAFGRRITTPPYMWTWKEHKVHFTCVHSCVNERMNEWMDGCTSDWGNTECINECMDERMNVKMYIGSMYQHHFSAFEMCQCRWGNFLMPSICFFKQNNLQHIPQIPLCCARVLDTGVKCLPAQWKPWLSSGVNGLEGCKLRLLTRCIAIFQFGHSIFWYVKAKQLRVS